MLAVPLAVVMIVFNTFLLPVMKVVLIFVASILLNVPMYIVSFKHRNYSLPIYSLPSFDRKPIVATVLSLVLAPVFTLVIEFRVVRGFFLRIMRKV